jgi:hypothetical protein
MGIKVVLNFGNFNSQFISVYLTGEKEGKAIPTRQGELPKIPDFTDLMLIYQQWKIAYEPFISKGKERIGNRNPDQIHDYSHTDIETISQDLVTKFNNWLEDKAFKPIRDQLFLIINNPNNEEIRVIIQTANPEIAKLPWCRWELIENCDQVEVAIAIPNQDTLNIPPKTTKKVNILAILGHDTGIDIDKDRQSLESLPDAKVEFLVKPNRSEISDQLWEQSWDILFFAGHSETDNDQGKIWINNRKYLTIEQLKYGLKKAIRTGLQLAIFNSCDGIGLGFDLAELNIPEIIVMREPVPDNVAQQFLQYFLKAYAQDGKSLYLAVREARERLQGLEGITPCASWLPMIFQNRAMQPMTYQELRRGFWSRGYSYKKRTNLDEIKLLNRVGEIWLVLLNKLVGKSLRIELDLEECQDFIYNAWGNTVEEPEQRRTLLPEGTKVIDVFDEIQSRKTLLILGKSGCGKTLSLLQFLEVKINDAKLSQELRIPVVFNLSTWRNYIWKNSQTFETWLLQELKDKYGINKAKSIELIKQQKLLLLLDGLDEVRENQREYCVEAINNFMAEYDDTEIVICSRIDDYQKIRNRLHVTKAIVIKKLKKTDIDQYLKKAQTSKDLQGLEQALKSDSSLLKLAESPLWLNIMTLVYQGVSKTEIAEMSEENRRKDLLNRYVSRMLFRRFKQDTKDQKQAGIERLYSDTKTLYWLKWLAQQMIAESETIFLIERLQPSWLSSLMQRYFYRLGIQITFALFLIFLLSLMLGITWKFLGQFITAFIFAMMLMMQSKLQDFERFFIDKIETIETLKWSWTKAFKQLFREQTMKMIVGGIVVFWLIQILNLLKLFNSLVINFGVYINNIFHSNFHFEPVIESNLKAGLIAGGLLTIILDVFLEGMHGPNLEKTITPNHGIKLSLKNSLILGSLLGLIAMPIWGITGCLTVGIKQGLMLGLLAFPFVGFSFGFYSSMPFIQHLILRIILTIKGNSPVDYARFLDYASRLILLQKVGGGYIFIHRLLQEHFSKMEIEQK